MASSDLRKELDCSICLNIYTDLVSLRCGHNFCRVCIDQVLDIQEEYGGYCCPECREEFEDRPELQKNVTLRKIVEALRSKLNPEETEIFCSHCIQSPVPAVKSCLMCEASLCNDHLRVHSKSPEHVLLEPTTNMENRKCSIHRELLKYYCGADDACICASCRLDGEHQGHEVQTLDEASKNKKERLKNVLEKLIHNRKEADKEVQNLQLRRKQLQEKSVHVRERVCALFNDLRKQLEDLEKRSLREISRQEEQFSLPLSNLINELEVKKEELSRKVGHIEEICETTDPLTVLQESDTMEFYNTEEGNNSDRERHDELLHDGRDLDITGIFHTLHSELSDILKGINVCFYVQEASDIVLDVNTAHNYLQISGNNKTVCRFYRTQDWPETAERFQTCSQVLSKIKFNSGRHYWDVDVRESDWWGVGVCYPSIDRRGEHSDVAKSNKCWCFYRSNTQNSMIHDSDSIRLPDNICRRKVRVFLDYEAGRLSFYDLSDCNRHLHTFTATFTEPLHVVLAVGTGFIRVLGGRGVSR